MGNKMPAAAKPSTAPLSQRLADTELAAAIKQVRAGTFDLFLAWCRANGKPPALADWIALGFKLVGELKATIALDTGENPDQLDAQFELLKRSRPTSVDEAEKIADRLLELERRHTVRTRRDEAQNATVYLESLKGYLAEFFGIDRATVKVAALPGPFHAFCLEHFDSQPPADWRDAQLPPPPSTAKRRKVRVAGI